ncbi:MAG: hypothetical protein IT529_03080 [Burkholderiales bacterium]|nr:hypothetical protein [Burkholderiales bacterium]
MCGIFGIVVHRPGLAASRLDRVMERLYLLSESRGKEAAGAAVLTGGTVEVYKQPLPASAMIRRPDFRALWRRNVERYAKDGGPLAMIGHSRLVTNGLQGVIGNNQPVVKDGIVGVHNGIVVNDAALWSRHPELKRLWEVDTEVILSLTRLHLAGASDAAGALARTYGEIEGAASIALFMDDVPELALATNTGSLYRFTNADGDVSVFTSEEYILGRLLGRTGLESDVGRGQVRQVAAGRGALLRLDAPGAREFDLAAPAAAPALPRAPCARLEFADHSADDEERRARLARCTRCILPETFPMITFDGEGVCSVCRDYRPIELMGRAALDALAARHRRGDGRPDCVVAFSGGRDSSYMLHYVKRELGMNPVAMTYDWGMVTDIARRNQARLTGALGIEHVLVSADIRAKRRNIRRNVLAWLRRPSLGMIPLFMAGDKQYFWHLERVRRQFGVTLAFLGGNPLEKTGFKTGFAGVRETAGGRTYDLPVARKLQVARYYGAEFLLNPAYLNRSLLDTAHAFYASYVMSHDFLWLYRYIAWDEKEIDGTLAREYGWEVATDTDTTWRIGDGTAAFYNYIYHTVAGFSENDTLRSNQLREGLIDRDEALALAARDNQPRYPSMREYAYQVGFDLDEALYVINSMPKLY